MEAAKIQFSAEEMKLAANAEWILTKNAVLQKVKDTLEAVHLYQISLLRQYLSGLPKELFKNRAKISKGENYQGLPYLILDYPRSFEKENIFAIRHFFWWGRFYSTTLHISGRWKAHFISKLLSSFAMLKENEFLVYMGKDNWDHDLSNEDYKSLGRFSAKDWEEHILVNPVIKIGVYSSVNQLNNADKTWSRQFEKLIKGLI